MERNHATQKLSLEVKTSSGLKVIYIKNILFIEAAKKFSIVHFADNNLITYHSLKWYMNYLLKPDFFRCHNSFIVNCQSIECYCSKEIRLKNNDKVPISRIRLRSLIENLKSLQYQA